MLLNTRKAVPTQLREREKSRSLLGEISVGFGRLPFTDRSDRQAFQNRQDVLDKAKGLVPMSP